MNNINRTGYTQGTNTESNSYNIIPSNIITMSNVNKPLTLIPIVNGKPRYDMRKIANPGDPDINFGEGVSGVLEIPYAQYQYNVIGGNTNPRLNVGMGVNYGFNNTPPVDSSLEGYNYKPLINQNKNNTLPKDDNFNYITGKNNDGSEYIKPDPWATPSWANQNELNKGTVDPNDIQKAKAEEVKQKGKPCVGAINPYGSWNMQNASVMLGASIEDGNALGIIGSAGKILTEGFRNGFSGAAAMRRFRDSQKEYMDKDAEARRREGEYWAGAYQDGGKVSKKSGLLLTGNFLEGNEDSDSMQEMMKYQGMLSGANIVNVEFDSKTNEYVITYN